MKYYKKPDSSVWAFESDGSQDEFITPDMVALTQAEIDAHINPPPDYAALIQLKEAQLRAAREVILNRLSGIALAAQLASDTATTAAYVTVRQGLLDITANLPTDATVDAVVVSRYAALVAQCTPQMITAFARLDQ